MLVLLAARVGRKLSYVGRVEWGATRAVIGRIRERRTVLSGPVCEGVERGRGIVWIHPKIVAEVSYSELMQGGCGIRCCGRFTSTHRTAGRAE